MANELVHFELPAEDTARAKQFWASLFGWTFNESDGPVEYHMFQGQPGGAIYRTQAGERSPIVYFGVEDIDASLRRVTELGGFVEEGKSAIPGIGWYARCSDTEGNRFSLFESDESVAPRG
jgi:predicted enzyme related to lactoylglutathione lyase